jgi:hypothetical protein
MHPTIPGLVKEVMSSQNFKRSSGIKFTKNGQMNDELRMTNGLLMLVVESKDQYFNDECPSTRACLYA